MSQLLCEGKKQKALVSPHWGETDVRGRCTGGLTFTFCAYSSSAPCVTIRKLLTLPLGTVTLNWHELTNSYAGIILYYWILAFIFLTDII